MRERRIEAEWLDQLPGHDPRAIRSRRDLRRINACMGNARLLARAAREAAGRMAPRRIVDLGSGDGALLLGWVRRMPAYVPAPELILVDCASTTAAVVVAELGARGFNLRRVQADGFEWLQTQPAEAGTWVLANLFLHHFGDARLRTLLTAVAGKAELCCACEPRRGWWPLAASRLLGLIGANAVTRHDAVASVRAGFQGRELSTLWPDDARWRLQEHRAGLFSHLFLARHT